MVILLTPMPVTSELGSNGAVELPLDITSAAQSLVGNPLALVLVAIVEVLMAVGILNGKKSCQLALGQCL